MEEDIRQIWAEGQDWVIRRKNNQFCYRQEGTYGEWLPGLPPGIFKPEAELLFNKGTGE